MKIKLLLLCMGASLSLVANAAVENDEPTYDCTAEETKLYVEQVTHNIFAPSTIPGPDEFAKSYAEQAEERAADGDSDAQSCSTIFSDGGLKDGWQDIVNAVREFDLGYDFSGINAAALQTLLKKAKEKAQEEFMNALEALGQDICAMMSTEALEEMLLDAINEQYGLNARNLRMADFADEITDEVMSNADEDVKMLLSEEKLKRTLSREGRSEMRKIRKDLWNKI